jgi:hypothetical protein
MAIRRADGRAGRQRDALKHDRRAVPLLDVGAHRPGAENCDDRRDRRLRGPVALSRLVPAAQPVPARRTSANGRWPPRRAASASCATPSPTRTSSSKATWTSCALGDVDALIDELVNKDWWKRRLDAMTEVEDLDEFKTIDRDRERMAELRELGVDERPRDEYEELERHFGRYNDLVEEKIKAAELPLRETTAALGRDELVAQIRRERISTESTQAFMDTFSRWEWLCGTFTCRDVQTRRLVWTDPAQLSDVAPEVLDAVRGAFAELEADLQRGPKGN